MQHIKLENEEVITTFGETPPESSTTIDEVHEADQQADEHEEEQKEKEEQQREDMEVPGAETEISADSMTDEELDQSDAEMLRKIRFLPHYSFRKLSVRDEWMLSYLQSKNADILKSKLATAEYGTPGGVSSDLTPGTCPSCADAADAVVLDATIVDTEGSEDEESTDAVDVDEENIEEDTDISQLLLKLVKYNENVTFRYSDELIAQESKIYGAESWRRLYFNTLVHATKLIYMTFSKLFKYANRVYRISRKSYLSSASRWVKASRFWSKKINNKLNEVNERKFAEMQTTAFPCDRWLDIAKVAITLYQTVMNCERIVFDRDKQTISSEMNKIQELCERNNISIGIGNDRLDLSSLLDERKFGSMERLGYRVSEMPNCSRYFTEISRCVEKDNALKAAGAADKCLQKVTKFAADLTKDMNKGNVDPKSDEYKVSQAMVVAYTSRVDFIMTCLRLSGSLFDYLAIDILKVFSKLEDSMN